MEQIPLKIGFPLFVQSMSDKNLFTRAILIGAVPGTHILIAEPTVRTPEGTYTHLEGELSCGYIQDGTLYEFTSNILETLPQNITLLQYPAQVETKELRKHERIAINSRCKLRILGNSNRILEGIIEDVSLGGCLVSLHKSYYDLREGSFCQLAFDLPNRAKVTTILGTVQSIHNEPGPLYKAGFKFDKMSPDLDVIKGFCDFCLFFSHAPYKAAS